MRSCFYLQYNGIFTDEEIIDLLENPVVNIQKLMYNFSYGCANEDQFLVDVLPQFYKQALFLRSHKQKILLNIDTDFFRTREVLNLVKLINSFYGMTKLDSVRPHKQTLYGFCSSKRAITMQYMPWIKYTLTVQEMREVFQYIRKRNYEVFDMFYSTPNVIAKGGKLVNEWSRNS